MLIANWRAVLMRAWSVRLLLVAAALSGAEVALPLIGHRLPLSEITRALLYFAIVSAALVARIVLQQKLKAHAERTSEGFDVDYWRDPGLGRR